MIYLRFLGNARKALDFYDEFFGRELALFTNNAFGE